MAVKKTNRTRNSSKSGKIDFMKAIEGLGEPASLIGGVVLGKVVIKKLTKTEVVSGLLGAETAQYFVPVGVAIGGMVGHQMSSSPMVKSLMLGVSGAGIEKTYQIATGKTLLGSLNGLLGDEDDYSNPIASLNPAIQMLPPADIDIEDEISKSVSGTQENYDNVNGTYDMSDEPVGDTDDTYGMSDEPVGETTVFDPDNINDDMFSGDMAA